MLKDVIRPFIPQRMAPLARSIWRKWRKSKSRSLTPLSEVEFRMVLRDRLQLETGDIVFVHSSIDYLSLEFPFFRILALLREVVGAEGTLLFPTYPKSSSYDFLTSNEIFDVRRTPSYTGALTELARRYSQSHRSIHPTKSVCAIGPLARELTADHCTSPYPYSEQSPYGKLVPCGGKVVGIGVPTSNLSFMHCVEDHLQDRFPVAPYHRQLFNARCINDSGETLTVPTYAHDMSKMVHNVPGFARKYIPDEICEDINIQGMWFFRANASPLFSKMTALARQGITIYPRSVYQKTQRAA